MTHGQSIYKWMTTGGVWIGNPALRRRKFDAKRTLALQQRLDARGATGGGASPKSGRKAAMEETIRNLKNVGNSMNHS